MKDSDKLYQVSYHTKWEDWINSLINYQRFIPGGYCVPLSLVMRKESHSDITHNPNFLDNYVSMPPLMGEAFNINTE